MDEGFSNAEQFNLPKQQLEDKKPQGGPKKEETPNERLFKIISITSFFILAVRVAPLVLKMFEKPQPVKKKPSSRMMYQRN